MSGDVRFSAEEVSRATGAAPVSGAEEDRFVGVSIDSRTVRPGQLFVAIRGKHFDGHDFIGQARARGAVGAVVERLAQAVGLKGLPVWVVPDSVAALGDLAGFHRQRFEVPVIAVTGSSGKSTTKMMLAHLLSATRNVLATPGTQNNRIGVPLTLFHLGESHQAVVLEMGTNLWGEIRRLTEIARPTLGVVTNIGPAHLETFGNLHGVLWAKGELWEQMELEASLVLNADDPMLWEEGQRLKRRIIWFGRHPKADVRADDIVCGQAETRCVVNGQWEMRVPLAGQHNLMNALAALAAAQVLGEPLAAATERIADVQPMPGRLSFSEQDGLLVIDDTYNANPRSLKAALEVLTGVERSGRRVVVVGDMLELGEQAERLHAEAGRWMVEYGVDFLVAVGPLVRRLLGSAWEFGLPRGRGRGFDTPEEAGEFLSSFVRRGDALLLKGSRGMQMERVLACFTISSTR